MNILPNLEDVRRLAASGEYKVVPISCEILSDICTPIEAMRILKNVSTHCYMLESAQQCCGRSWRTIRVRRWNTCHHSQAVWWAISPMIIWVTANRR